MYTAVCVQLSGQGCVEDVAVCVCRGVRVGEWEINGKRASVRTAFKPQTYAHLHVADDDSLQIRQALFTRADPCGGSPGCWDAARLQQLELLLTQAKHLLHGLGLLPANSRTQSLVKHAVSQERHCLETGAATASCGGSVPCTESCRESCMMQFQADSLIKPVAATVNASCVESAPCTENKV